MRKQMVVVEAYVPDAEPPPTDVHPEHPIYIPVEPPPDSGLSPEHPIYLPVYPDNALPGDQPHPDQGLPGDQPRPEHPIYLPQPTPPSGGVPSHPIYLPVEPTHPIVLPPEVDEGLTDEQKEALVSFLTGNLPPYNGPDVATPV